MMILSGISQSPNIKPKGKSNKNTIIPQSNEKLNSDNSAFSNKQLLHLKQIIIIKNADNFLSQKRIKLISRKIFFEDFCRNSRKTKVVNPIYLC